MKVEARLEKLEHEFKILKNEIQATLLEIQEQLLAQQYPALRSDDGAPNGSAPDYPAPTMASLRSEAPERLERTERPSRTKGPFAPVGNSMQRPQSPLVGYGNGKSSGSEGVSHRRGAAPSGRGIENARNGSQPSAVTPAFTDVNFEDEFADEFTDDDAQDGRFADTFGDTLDDEALNEERDDESSVTFSPHTREVSLSDIKRGRQEPGAAATRKPAEPKGPSAAAQRVNFAVLAEWVGSGVRTLGKERTRQAVETYAASGYVSPDVQKMILQLLALTPEQELPEPSGPTSTIDLLVKLDAILNNR